MQDVRQEREQKRARIRRKKRLRVLIIVAAVAILVLVVVLVVSIARAIKVNNRTPMDQIGPNPPVSEADNELTPLVRLYDYTLAVPEGAAVSDSVFANVLFVGDERLQNLATYAGIPAENILTAAGLNAGNVMTYAFSSGTLAEILETHHYSAIYLSLGINELGWQDTGQFVSAYGTAIDAIQEKQPLAAIYLHLIIPVTAAKSGNPSYVSNARIGEYNALIRALAVEKSVYFLDASSVLCDSGGALNDSYSSNGIHLGKDGIAVWYEYLKTHYVKKEQYDN